MCRLADLFFAGTLIDGDTVLIGDDFCVTDGRCVAGTRLSGPKHLDGRCTQRNGGFFSGPLHDTGPVQQFSDGRIAQRDCEPDRCLTVCITGIKISPQGNLGAHRGNGILPDSLKQGPSRLHLNFFKRGFSPGIRIVEKQRGG